MNYFLFEEFEREVDKDTTEILVSRPDGRTDTVKPFRNKLTAFTYDIEGYEHMVSRGEMYCYRYAPILPGEYRIYERSGTAVCKEYGFKKIEYRQILPGKNGGTDGFFVAKLRRE